MLGALPVWGETTPLVAVATSVLEQVRLLPLVFELARRDAQNAFHHRTNICDLQTVCRAGTQVVTAPRPRPSAGQFAACSGHAQCALNQFCATSCSEGVCQQSAAGSATQGKFCQPCKLCKDGSLSVTGGCSVCKVAGGSCPPSSCGLLASNNGNRFSHPSTYTNARPANPLQRCASPTKSVLREVSAPA